MKEDGCQGVGLDAVAVWVVGSVGLLSGKLPDTSVSD